MTNQVPLQPHATFGSGGVPGATVGAGVECASCGYALEGLNHTDVCPECTYPVARSAQGDLLRWAPLAWVGSVARGVRLLRYSTLGINAVVVLFLLIMAGVFAVAIASQPGRFVSVALGIVGITAVGLAGLALITQIVGVWFLTSRSGNWRMLDDSSIVMVRGSGLLFPVVVVLSHLNIHPFGVTNPSMYAERALFQGVCGVFLFSLYRLLRALAARTPMPERERSKAVRTARSNAVVACVIMVIAGWVLPLLSAGRLASNVSNATLIAVLGFVSMSALVRRLNEHVRLEFAIAREQVDPPTTPPVAPAK